MNLDNCLFSYWLAWFVGLLVGIALVVWVWVSDWVYGKFWIVRDWVQSKLEKANK